MFNGEIQYIADTLLVEKLAKLDFVLTKEAGLVNDIFSGVGSAVSSYVKSHMDFSSPGATAKSVLNILAPGMLFRVHPLLAFLYYIGNEYGYDVVGTIQSIVDSISNKIKSGEQVSPEEVNQAALSKAASEHNDLFYEIRKLEKSGSLIKSAQRSRRPVGGSFFGSRKNSLLHNLFGFLDKRTGKSVFVGFIAWFIKTILLSAGLLAVGEGAKKVIQKGKESVVDDEADNTKTEQSMQSTQPSEKKQNKSEQLSKDEGSWYMPIVGGSVQNTVMDWVKEFYPDLSGYEDIILKTPSFNSVVRDLSRSVSGSYLVLPGSFDKKSTVDRFIKDVDKEIDKLKEAKQ